MNRRVRLVAAASAGLTVLALAAPTAQAASGIDSSVLRAAVTSANAFRHLNALDRIADANGGTRATGTPGFDASLAYVKGLLDATGYYNTRAQEFDFEIFRELVTPEFQRISPDPRTYAHHDDFSTMGYSGSGDVTGSVVPTNDVMIPPGSAANSSTSGCELSDFPPASATEPQVALIQRGTCRFSVKAQNAEAAGYDAVIIFNEGQDGRTETANGTLGQTVGIPVIGASYAVGEELYNLVQAGAVTVRVATSTQVETRATANLLADTKSGRSDRVVVVGSHLDSVPGGPGVNDNGSGIAQNLEIALQLAALGIQPRNQVRFAWWSAEEWGLIGSQYYVDSLTSREIKDIAVNLNFDMVASPNAVRFVYDGDGSDTASLGSTGSGVVESVFVDYFASQGLASAPTAFNGRSDYDAFISAGIPAGGTFTGAEGIKTAEQAATYGGRAGAPYDPCYHQACDTVANIDTVVFDQMMDAAAHATLLFAMTDSVVQGSDQGKALGHGDYQADALRR